MPEEEKIVSVDALLDNRSQELKNQDYSTAELVEAAAVVPFQNEKPTKLGATEFNQWYVGSCVPHGFWTQLEYEGIINADFKPSQLRSYRKRTNYPSAGSNGVDMYDQIRDGQSTDFPTPSKFRETDATKLPYIKGDKLIKDFKYFQYINQKTGQLLIEDIPQDIATGKAVTIFIFATDDEWSQEYVEIKDNINYPGEAEVRHCVCIMPSSDFTENGKQWFAVHDSAKFGGRHLRYVSFEFLKKRCYFAAKVYPVDAIPEPEIPPVNELPIYPVELGDKGDNVKLLQKFLIDKGKLESKYLTGYYGSLTSKAVLWWQLENWDKFTSQVPELLELKGEFWGSQSIAALNN